MSTQLPRNQDELLRGRFLRNCEKVVEQLWDAFESGLDTKLVINIREKSFQPTRKEEIHEEPIELFKKEEVYSRNATLQDLIIGAASVLVKVQEDKISGYTRNEVIKPCS